MPLYQYICGCGTKSEAWRPMSESGKGLRCNNCMLIAPRLIGCQLAPPSATSNIRSESMGCWPGQQAESTEYAVAKGCTGFEYKEDGHVAFDNRASRKQFAEAHGFHDRDAGYSDPTPKTQAQQEEHAYVDKELGISAVKEDTPNQGPNEPVFIGGD